MKNLNKEMEQIINQIPTTWSKDMIIRFLYIKLAPFFRRDLAYFLASDEEKLAQYQKGFVSQFPNVVCFTLADFYVNLFQEFGIEAKKVVATSSVIPLFAVVVKGDLGWYFLDPLADLFANQYGLRPYFFGVIPRYRTIQATHPELKKLDKEYVTDLDKSLQIPEYLDSYFEYLHQQLANRDIVYKFFDVEKGSNNDLRERKVQFFNDNLINIGNVTGLFERALLYRYLNDHLLNHSERRNVWVQIDNLEQDNGVFYNIKLNDLETISYKEVYNGEKFVLQKTLNKKY